MSRLKYPWTCPAIDCAIEKMQDRVETVLTEVWESPACSFTYDKLSETIDDMQTDLCALFEELREENSNMRDAADEQLEALATEIEELTEQIAELEKNDA